MAATLSQGAISVLLCAPLLALAIEGLPQFEWPETVPAMRRAVLEGSACPKLDGIYQPTGDAYIASCRSGSCGTLQARAPETLYPVSAHPRSKPGADHSFRWVTDAPESLRGKARTFQLVQSGVDQLLVIIALADAERARFALYSRQQGDFSCAGGALALSKLPIFLGDERSLYRAGDQQILLLGLEDRSLVYLVHQRLTRRVLFGLLPTDSEDTLELIRYRPADR